MTMQPQEDNSSWSEGPADTVIVPASFYTVVGGMRPMQVSPQDFNSNGQNRNNGGNRNGAKVATGLDALDLTPLFESVIRRWPWLLLASLAMAAAGLFLGLKLWKNGYTATALVVRVDAGAAGDYYKPQQITEQTFASLLRSPDLMKRVANRLRDAGCGEMAGNGLELVAQRNVSFADATSDVIGLALTARDPQLAVDQANIFAQEAVKYTSERQRSEAEDLKTRLQQQLAQLDENIVRVNAQLRSTRNATVVAKQRTTAAPIARPTIVAEKLQAARDELIALESRYTDAHPQVQQQKAKVEALEKQLADSNAKASGLANTLPSEGVTSESVAHALSDLMERDTDVEIYRSNLQALETGRVTLEARLREAEHFSANSPGYCKIFAPAVLKDVTQKSNRLKSICLAILFGVLGIVGTGGLFFVREFMDDRIKTADDVSRITHLPVLAALGDLRQMSPAEQSEWAFRAWTALQGRLSPSPNHGLICGVTSSKEGEGRSTWINLLAQAASQRGFRVLTISTRPSAAYRAVRVEDLKDDETEDTPAQSQGATELLCLDQVTRKLVSAGDKQPMVHIPLPGWVWNLERRKQWQTALAEWGQIDNLVILTELPAASVPEAVLLAENLPNLIWLASTDRASARASRAQLQTLRNARCNLVGAVLNREKIRPMKERFARWMPVFAFCLGCMAFSCTGAWAADPTSPATAAPPGAITYNDALSFGAPPQRAQWQQRLTLGPGDVLNVSLYGQPELTKQEVAIGPDGRISFAEAQDVVAAGLTIDELRAAMDSALSKYHRSPHSIITPVAFRSKKYFVLGRVVTKGVGVLDRPTTVIEAVARARGFETTLADANVIETVDFSRSFLARGGQRMPVDFEKLFRRGDLTQNVSLEPDDYLYFAPEDVKEVYVLGEVKNPGPYTFTPGMTAVGAIASRGGFTGRAWTRRVLVIRGSLSKPETFIINATAVLAATEKDLELQPRDLVYVTYRPWVRVEELLDSAASAFVEAAVISYTGVGVKPFFTRPVVK